MPVRKILFLFAFSICFSAALHAQIEVAHLTTKGLSSADAHLLFLPLLVSYRHAFGPNGTGFYLEPLAGYTIGSTDIQQTNANGTQTDDLRASGPAAGLAALSF